MMTCFLLVQATKDLENYDAERHEEFKRYEMLKEHERREYLKGLDQEKREKEEKRMQELKEKHRQHPKVNAPVGQRMDLCSLSMETGGSGSSFLTCFCCVLSPSGKRCSAEGSLGGDGRTGSTRVQP